MVIAVNARFLIKDKLEGIGWYTYELLKRMILSNPNDKFILLFDRFCDPSFKFGPNVTTYVLYPSARRSYLWYFWFEWRVYFILKRLKPDVFFSPDGFLSLNLKIPQLLVIHDLAYLHYPKQIPYFARNYYKYFIPKYIKKADHVFCVSEATKKDVISYIKIDSNKLSIAYNGCRPDFKPLTNEKKSEIRNIYSFGQPYFLAVGALHPRKNIDKLIYGFELFKKQNQIPFKLIIVGRKAFMTDAIEKAFRLSEYEEDIIFYNYMESEALANVTGAAVASVNPSFLEGFGVPVLEALYCGVPVIVSNRFSLPEVAGPGAYVVDPNSIHSISKAMTQVVQDNDIELSNRIFQGLDHAKKFTWDATADHIFETIKKYDHI